MLREKTKKCICEDYEPNEPHETVCLLNQIKNEKTEVKITPRPWHKWGQYQVRDKKNRILLSTSDAKTMENEGNTDFIVTACNAWDNIEALESRIKELKEKGE